MVGTFLILITSIYRIFFGTLSVKLQQFNYFETVLHSSFADVERDGKFVDFLLFVVSVIVVLGAWNSTGIQFHFRL